MQLFLIGACAVHVIAGLDSTQADRDWARIETPPQAVWDSARRATSTQEAIEIVRRAKREAGWRFYNAYPNDARRWRWLIRTVSEAPKYFADLDRTAQLEKSDSIAWAPLDTVMLHRWERAYAIMRHAFFESPQVTEDMRSDLRARELLTWLDPVKLAIIRGEPVDLHPYFDAIVEYGAMHPESVPYIASPYFNVPEVRVDSAAESDFMQRLLTIPGRRVQEYAKAKIWLHRARRVPLEFQFPNADGVPIDLARLRGHMVLLDFWATSCGGCIAAFPKYKALYQRYHDRGFEIVSITLDAHRNRQTAMQVLQRYNLPWLHVLTNWDGPDIEHPLIRQFGIFGVPFLVLLDREGRVVLDGDINIRTLEQHLQSAMPVGP